MYTKLMIFLFIAVSLLPKNQLSAQKLYESDEGKFKINFVKTPEESINPVETGAGSIDMHMFSYEESTSNAYMLAYCDYPLSLVNDDDPYVMLNNAVNGFIEQLQLTSEKTEKLKFNKNYCALQIKAKSDDFFVVLKDIMVGNRLYQIAIMRSDRYPNEYEIKSFIGSFQLIEK